MRTRKIVVDWQKIINGDYSLWNYDILNVYRWLLNISKNCQKQKYWDRWGFHQTFHGYSHNNDTYNTYMLAYNYNSVLYNGFVNILCKTDQPKIVADFLKSERIELGRKRIITIEETEDENKYYERLTGHVGYSDIIEHLTSSYKDLLLKKEYFHPEYKDRLNPRIIDNINFGTRGECFSVELKFSFDGMYDANNCSFWTYEISQKEKEPLRTFFNRAIQEIDLLLIQCESCNNCPLWTPEERHGTYLRYGYRGYCESNHECNKKSVEKYHSWVENGKICDNAKYISFPTID